LALPPIALAGLAGGMIGPMVESGAGRGTATGGAQASPGDITRVLRDLEQGDASASARLVELAYEELRRMVTRRATTWSPAPLGT